MFGGEEQRVKLRFANHLAGVVIDRFGKDTMFIPDGDEYFTVNVDVVPSTHFLAWVFSFGTEAKIISPESVKQEMKKQIQQLGGIYK